MIVESFSGVRGEFGKDITTEIIERYAYSYSQFLNSLKTSENKKSGNSSNLRIVIGMDSRQSGDEIKRIFISCLTQLGIDIIDVSISTTPAIENAVRVWGCDGGIIITASHNPPSDNGWKILSSFGSVLLPLDMELVINNSHNVKKTDLLVFRKPESKKVHIGKIEELASECNYEYLEMLTETIGKKGLDAIKSKNYRLLFDPNGGSVIPLITDFAFAFHLEIEVVNSTVGKFNRLIEPNKDSLSYLVKKISNSGFEFACGFDCDADRVEIVINPNTSYAKENSSMISGQHLLGLIVKGILRENSLQKNTVVVNDATSGIVKEICSSYNANLIEVEVGEINVVSSMDKHSAIVGGEGSSSGPIVPPSRCRDGLMTVALILKYMALSSKSISDLLLELPRYYTLRENLKCKPEMQQIVREKIENHFVLQNYKIQKTGDNSGGLKIIIDDKSWIWYRGSKTEAGVYRIIVDSNSENKAKELLKIGIDTFNEFSK